MANYPKWLREAASKGGKKSKRKLSKAEAKRIAALRWQGAVGSGDAATKRKSANEKDEVEAPRS